jgi:hydroxymethylbilane synthase
MPYEKKIVRIGARGSKLSRAQLHLVQTTLQQAWPEIEFSPHIIETSGDRDQKSPLPEIGGKGLFTAELEAALHQGQIDLAVHSQKDLPVQNPKGLSISAIVKRHKAQDAFISSKGYTLETLHPNARIGTSSTRRKAQLLAFRPDFEVLSLRGNIDTRLKKAVEFDGIILAYAGLERLKLDIGSLISEQIMLPAPAQGALAIQCRDEPFWHELLAPIHHVDTADCTLAERSFLEALGGGCSLPIAALAHKTGNLITLEGQVLNKSGTRQIRDSLQGTNPVALAQELAQRCIERGALELIGE